MIKILLADDEAVEHAKKPNVKKAIRTKYRICEEDFLIITGGKIDAFKTQTLLLLQAVREIEDIHVYAYTLARVYIYIMIMKQAKIEDNLIIQAIDLIL